MAEGVRLDVALHRLCVTRSRSEAKNACAAGAVLVDGRAAKASQVVEAGEIVAVRFAKRLLEIRLLEVPLKGVPKHTARGMFEIVRDERVEES